MYMIILPTFLFCGNARATQCSRRPIKSICSRLKAKEGRVRENMLGKSVDFSARTLITPDPNIDMMNLTYPETVKLSLHIILRGEPICFY